MMGGKKSSGLQRYDVQVGAKVGRWTVLSEGKKDPHLGLYFHCQCECGIEREILATRLRCGRALSCGCLTKEIMSKVKRVHGATTGVGINGQQKVSTEYNIWMQMKRRCYDSKHHNFKYYGARGIQVCGRWRDSFVNFLADMGHRPSPQYSLDRRDYNGDYEPSNCRWATNIEQARNKRNNHMVTVNGVARCISEWAQISGLSRREIYKHIKDGRSLDDLLSGI